MIRKAFLAALFLLPILAWSQTGAATYGPKAYTTAEGCQVILTSELTGGFTGMSKSKDYRMDSSEIHWTGRCDGGLAEGPGQLNVSFTYTNLWGEQSSLRTHVLTSSSGKMRKGRFIDDEVHVAGRTTFTENGVESDKPLDLDGVLTQKNGIPVRWVEHNKGKGGLVTTSANFDEAGVIKDSIIDLGGGHYQRSTFRDGQLFEVATDFGDGVTTFRPDASGKLVVVSDKTPSATETTSEATSSSDAGNVFVGVLGAISNGIASAGGKNAATLKAVGSALQSASGYGGAQPGSSEFGKSSQSKLPPGIKSVPSVNDCVGMIRSSFDTTLVNKCSFAVHHTYCVVASGSLSKNMTACQNHQLQSQYIEANGGAAPRI